MTIIKNKNKDRDILQKRAIQRWIANNKHGTVEMSTGLGKTFIGLHALYEMPINKDVDHLFLAEVHDRYDDLLKQITLYKIIFKRDVLKDYSLKFMCYQSSCKIKDYDFGLIIADRFCSL